MPTLRHHIIAVRSTELMDFGLVQFVLARLAYSPLSDRLSLVAFRFVLVVPFLPLSGRLFFPPLFASFWTLFRLYFRFFLDASFLPLSGHFFASLFRPFFRLCLDAFAPLFSFLSGRFFDGPLLSLK